MGWFSIFGGNRIKDALRKGGVVIDVRTPHEFDQGKVPGSINIPIDRIPVNIERIRNMKRPIIFCCESGQRSGSALRIMKENGIKEVFNGGSWESVFKLQQKI